jgi:hypothetical protein
LTHKKNKQQLTSMSSYRSYESAQKDKNGTPVYGMDKELRDKQMGKYDKDKERQVLEWIGAVTGTRLSGDLHSALKSGVVLCQLLNAIKAGTVSKISNGNMPFMQMENIQAFLTAAEKMGLQAHDSFRTVDLYEAKNIPQVINALFSFGSVVQTKSFYGNKPKLGIKLAEKSNIQFSDQQLREAKNATSLQNSAAIKHDTGRSISREVVKVNDTGDNRVTSQQSQASIKHDTGRSISREVVKTSSVGDTRVTSQQSQASIKHDTGRSISKEVVKTPNTPTRSAPPPPKTTTTTSSSTDPYAELEKLASLKNKGIITQQEFDAKKKQLLGL